MVRRKVVGVGKQLSLPAYQQLMSQGSSFRAPARQPQQVASMADYWHNMCWSKLSGAVPRMAVVATPEPSSRRLTRLRRQLMWSPTEIVNVPQPKSMRMVQANYVRQQQQQQQHAPAQLQLGYPPTWGGAQWEAPRLSHPPVATNCRPMKSSSWGDYQIGAAMAQQHQNSASSLNIIECPGCQSEVPVCYFETESSRFAAAASRIEQQQEELHQKQLQLQKLQEFHLSPQPSQVNTPVGILKNAERPEGGQNVPTELHAKKMKRVTIHAMNGMDGKLHERVLAPGKPNPLAKPGGNRRISQQKKEPQRDQPQGYQRKHQPAHEQHPPASVKLPQQQQSPCTFNFGKFVNNFIDSYDHRSSVSEGTDSDSGSFILEPPNAGDTAVKPKKSSKVSSKAGSKAGSLNREPPRPPEWPKVERILSKTEPEKSKRKGKRSSRLLGDHHGADSGTSTSTLTKEKSRDTLRTPKPCVESARRSRLVPKTPHHSQTSLKPEQAECPAREKRSSLDVHEGISGQAPDSVGKKDRIRKVNINQLLQNPELQDGSVVWQSLMQLVGQMCSPLEEEEDDQPESETCEEQRMMAGYGSDLRQKKKMKKKKQYSVYLMVNSDDDNDDQEYSTPKLETESPDILAASHSHNQISCESHNPNQTLDESHNHNQQDDYANHCYRLFQEEQCKPMRRKRKRRSVSRIKELAYPYPMPPPNQVLRRPLHWPKPDMSKPQTRLQRPRSTAKPPAQKRRQRSISTVQQQLHAQRQWEKIPLATASCMMYPMMNSAMRHHF
ncbi:uncharacterized protein LOC111074070 [Drosophila obscura]|uniref:uncharacterized protein LOC111074070 n=1 Tax=Drosophila obscura TaxID=7282 RepID=UPI001BB1B9C7|nr:uncharacterized protein LOC111074070 [Drosophila obscura]